MSNYKPNFVTVVSSFVIEGIIVQLEGNKKGW